MTYMIRVTALPTGMYVRMHARAVDIMTPGARSGSSQWQTCMIAKILIKAHFFEPLPLAT